MYTYHTNKILKLCLQLCLNLSKPFIEGGSIQVPYFMLQYCTPTAKIITPERVIHRWVE